MKQGVTIEMSHYMEDFAINRRFTPLDVYYLMGVHREIPSQINELHLFP
ncbi:MAG: hypothetical protein JRE20_06155 [Deltaproteobacteria bacterium]|jgi:hypothetical protein|nr:hypothetical protein [Deltaproteobacteria bacterium]